MPALRAVIDQTLNSSQQVVFTTTSSVIAQSGTLPPLASLAFQCNVTVTTPSNVTWVGANVNQNPTNTITITAHGLLTGTAVTLTTTGGLPTGLSTSTTYYIITVDANTVSFASSLANAKAGTAIHLTSAGTGTGTVNVTALAGGALQLQCSLDNSNWVNDGSSQSVTGAGTFNLQPSNSGNPANKYYQVQIQATSGQLTVTTLAYGKAFV